VGAASSIHAELDISRQRASDAMNALRRGFDVARSALGEATSLVEQLNRFGRAAARNDM
jgi:hypothetical protein